MINRAILRGLGVLVTDRRTDRQTDICNSRVAFMTEDTRTDTEDTEEQAKKLKSREIQRQ